MIQILGLRDVNAASSKKKEVFFEKGMRLSSISEVFTDKVAEVIKALPESEHYNLYYTVANCFESSGRKMQEQWAIPFDVDSLDIPADADEDSLRELSLQVVDVCARAIGLEPSRMAVVFSGNGVQFFILLTKPMIDEGIFARARTQYKALTDQMHKALTDAGIVHKMDTSVWSKARLMRLPTTLNRKKDRPERRAFVVHQGEPQDFRIDEDVENTTTGDVQQMDSNAVKAWPTPDTDGILKGCAFIKHCYDKQAEIQEPSWYAMLTIIARLENGNKLAHEYSNKHPDYNHYEVEEKYGQALESGYPRTCKDISTRWDGCKNCEYYGKVVSPIMIRGKNFIASADYGYRQRVVKVGSDGQSKITAGKPVYEDLVKQYEREHSYCTLIDNDQVIIYNGKHWEYTTERQIKAWMTEKVRPEPSSAEMSELIERLKSKNVTSLQEIQTTRNGKMNFANYVVDVLTGETAPHSKDFGFFSVLPYNYDPRAKAPTFNYFMNSILPNKEDTVQALKEFLGYCISGDEYWHHGALILFGTGENGKSVLFNLLGEMVGKQNYSAIPLQDLMHKTSRKALENKLFNYSEETSVHVFKDSELFKTLTAGGEIVVKQLYVQEYTIKNKAKIIMSCNKMPATSDLSHGFLRRMIVIHLKESFKLGDPRRDPNIFDKLVKEMSGIYNELISAYKTMRKRGRLEITSTMREAVEDLVVENDAVYRFVEDVVLIDSTAQVTTSELYSSYTMYAVSCGEKPLPIMAFSRRISEILNKQSDRFYSGGVQMRGFKGITVRKEF